MIDSPERNFSARVAYDGTAYSGFQLQSNAPTVQGEIEKALGKVFGGEIRLHASSRTDAGVHAVGQVISFRRATSIPADEIERAVNAVLSPDIRIGPVMERDDDFHARYSVKGKHYIYRIHRGDRESPFLDRYALWIWGDLDVDQMNWTTSLFSGKRDCRSFSPRLDEGEEPVKKIFSVWIEKHGDLLEISMAGSGFLYQMARRIAASIVEVGKGALKREEVEGWLANPEVGACKIMLPAKGLFLMDVMY
jgi:tRNA pseudouridine38-40 synthase